MIYLDNSATTQPDPSVLESYQSVSEKYFANPSSIHQLGGEAEKLLLHARQQVADLLGVLRHEIIFTSGGTEGNNLAIKGIAFEHQNRGKHIITTQIEHPSVFDACKNLERLGFEVTYLPVNEDGVISVEELKNSIRDDTILVSVMHVNNEIGSIQPIKEIGEIAKKHPKLFFHVDNVQGLGKVPLELTNSGIDLCTFSGHKIHGLKGTGILYVRNKTTLFSLFHGGNQEGSIRSGTENLAGAVAMARALRLTNESETTDQLHLKKMQQYLRNQLQKNKEIDINTPINSAPHIMNISVRSIKPEIIIHMLGKKKIYISTKSACSSKQTDESRILVACGYGRDRSTTALRVSMSSKNTLEEIKVFLRGLNQAIKQLNE